MVATSAALIETDRLTLLPLGPAGAVALMAGHRPPGSRWALGYPTEVGMVGAGMLVAAARANRQLGGWGGYQVVRDSDGVVLGDCAFAGPPDDDGVAHVRCRLCSGHEGRGYEEEAIAALVGWALRQPGVVDVLTT